MIKIYEQLLEALKSLLGIYREMSLSELARQDLGKDFTADTVCPDEVSCSYAVTTVLNSYFKLRGKHFPIIFGTDLLDRELSVNKNFEKITNLKDDDLLPPNCVIVSPRTITVNGHTGITDVDGFIMNNNSVTGLWVKSYTRESWRKKFVNEKGLVSRVYKVII